MVQHGILLPRDYQGVCGEAGTHGGDDQAIENAIRHEQQSESAYQEGIEAVKYGEPMAANNNSHWTK